MNKGMVIIAIFFIIMIAIGIYSMQTAKTFCREKDMEFYDLIQKDIFDLKDDIICYSRTGNNMEFYYFERN